MNAEPVFVRAAMIVDGMGIRRAPGALLLERGRIIAAGDPRTIGEPGSRGPRRPAGARLVDLPGHVIIPALVNAHAHLDLTHIGPMPYPGDFVSWVDVIRSRRAERPEEIAASVGRGADLAIAGGTAVIGDIAGIGSTDAVEALRASDLAGVSYVEVFGHGRRQVAAIERMNLLTRLIEAEAGGVRLGVQPHAPYSCGPEVYAAAAAMGMPVATHLAETLEEIRFTATGDGPLAEMLKRIGVWDETITGCGMHPIDALRPALQAHPILAAHLNYIEDRHIEALAQWPISVAYCPRASDYFGHGRGPQSRFKCDRGAPQPPVHRYRDMLQAGVNVCLGTDSIVCLDTPDRISVLDEMRLLHRRDGTDPQTLLRMATTAGAEALGFDPAMFTLAPGPAAGLLACEIEPASNLDPLRQVLMRSDRPRWLLRPPPLAA